MKLNHSPFIILASASPRRKFLMRQAGYRFKVHASHVSERVKSGLTPQQIVRFLALKKARAMAQKYPNNPILAADTLVYINNHVVGKPTDSAHAVKILKELSGAWQKVYTGVAVIWVDKKIMRSAVAVSSVKMRLLTEKEIISASTKHLDKAGAYAVQEKGDGFVEKIKGDYDNVVGLPMRLVKKLLRLPGRHPFLKVF